MNRSFQLFAVAAALVSTATACRAQPPAASTVHTAPRTPRSPMDKPSDAELNERKKQLTPVQFNVTQKEGTEPPFRNAFFDKIESTRLNSSHG